MADEILWHYTNAEACHSILQSNTLRLTNVWTYRSQPETGADWEEFENGLQRFSQIRYKKAPNLVWSNLNEIVKLYAPFVMCFSKSDANPTLWKERAGPDGVSLGFSRRKFFDAFPKSLTFETDNSTVTYDLHFGDCIYDAAEKDLQISDDSIDLNVRFAEYEPSFPLAVLFRAVFLKRESFSSEREVRFALAPSQLPAGKIPGLSYCSYYSLSPEKGRLPLVAVAVMSEKARERVATELNTTGYANVDIRLRSTT